MNYLKLEIKDTVYELLKNRFKRKRSRPLILFYNCKEKEIQIESVIEAPESSYEITLDENIKFDKDFIKSFSERAIQQGETGVIMISDKTIMNDIEKDGLDIGKVIKEGILFKIKEKGIQQETLYRFD